jgi:hypothetical protein
MKARKYLPPRFCVLKTLFISPLSQQACFTPPSTVPLKDILKTFDLFLKKKVILKLPRFVFLCVGKRERGREGPFQIEGFNVKKFLMSPQLDLTSYVLYPAIIFCKIT